MSAKASAQPPRRTPLSLSGATSKQQQQQQGQRPTSNSNDNSSSSRNDNKTTSLKTEQAATTSNNQKDNKNNNKQTTQQIAADKKLQQQNIADKKSQQQNSKAGPSSNVANSGSAKKAERNDEKKTQNGVGNGNSNNGNSMEKHQNGKESAANDNTKDKKDKKIEKVEKIEKPVVNVDKKEKLEKEKDKKKELEKEKEKEKERAKDKELEEKEMEQKVSKHEGIENKPLKDERHGTSVEIVEKKPQDEKNNQQHQKKDQAEKQDTEQMEISASEETPQVPVTPTKKIVEPKLVTPHKPVTPLKAAQPSPFPNNPSSTSTNTSVRSVVTTSTTTTIDVDDEDENMEHLVVEGSPKKHQPTSVVSATSIAVPKPAATSTPGKFLTFKEIFFSDSPSKAHQPVGSQLSPQSKNCPRTFSQISGRRSIRPGSDAYTPSYIQSNMHNRESYRRINTELDVTSNTNTSLNVTVGSEVPNNSSFSFFGRGRKRDRTPPYVVTQSTVDLDLETSPKSPKRARIDMHGFFSAVASPLSMLRSRFSKTSIQSSTPVRLANKLSAVECEEDEGEVQNVSGISIEEEELEHAGDDVTATEEITVGNEAAEEKKEVSSTNKQDSARNDEAMATDADSDAVDDELVFQKCGAEKPCDGTESPNTEDVVVVAKNKKCSIM